MDRSSLRDYAPSIDVCLSCIPIILIHPIVPDDGPIRKRRSLLLRGIQDWDWGASILHTRANIVDEAGVYFQLEGFGMVLESRLNVGYGEALRILHESAKETKEDDGQRHVGLTD
jgi:hypothetical protein